MNQKYSLLWFLFLLEIVGVRAARVNSTGGGDGSCWNRPVNWSSGSVPGPDDDVIIDLAGDVIVIVAGSQTVKSLENHEVLWPHDGALGDHAKPTVTNGVVNAGRLVLSSAGGRWARLTVSRGTLTNASGEVIEAQVGDGHIPYLEGSFLNPGTVAVQTNAVLNLDGPPFLNERAGLSEVEDEVELDDDVVKERMENLPLPHIDSLLIRSDGQVRLSLNGKAGDHYILQNSEDLNHWYDLWEDSVTSELFEFLDEDAGKAGQRFYRMIPAQ